MAPDETDYFQVGPDPWIRRIAEGIDAADVLFLRLEGKDVSDADGETVWPRRDVDDPAVIGSVLRALRAAASSTAVLMDRVNAQEIHLRPGSASAARERGEPVFLHFNPFSKRSNLGMKFARALAKARACCTGICPGRR